MENKHRGVFLKRKKTLKKKARELSILCGIEVALICCDTDDDVETWPENSDAVSRILLKYYKGNADMSTKILKSNRDLTVYPSWSPEFDYLSEQPLTELLNNVNDTIKKVEAKLNSYQDDEVDSDKEEDNDKKEEDEADGATTNGLEESRSVTDAIPGSSTSNNNSNS